MKGWYFQRFHKKLNSLELWELREKFSKKVKKGLVLSAPGSLFQKVTFWQPLIVKIQSPKRKTWRGTLHDITQGANALNSTLLILHFASSSLRIHVEFMNDERGKEKDRRRRRLYYWLNLSYYWQFSNKFLLNCWSSTGDFCQNFSPVVEILHIYRQALLNKWQIDQMTRQTD